LYDEAPIATGAGDAAVTAEGLAALALVAFVPLLVAFVHIGVRSGGLAPLPGDEAGRAADAGAGSHRAASDPEPSHLPARDRAEALRLSGGSADIADALLAQMLAELPAQADSLAAAAAAADWATARDLGRGMRAGTAVCAVPALHAAVGRLEAVAAAQDPGAVAAALTLVEREARRLAFDPPFGDRTLLARRGAS
jgi:HPt (histidine-containing phosphotransfer) domain-containing protein